MAAMLDANFIMELDSLEQLYAEWDALAVSSAQPLMAPGWLLAWWRHIAPDNALLRAIEIRDGAELVGLAPFFAEPILKFARDEIQPGGSGPLTAFATPGVGGFAAGTDWLPFTIDITPFLGENGLLPVPVPAYVVAGPVDPQHT